ncbi:MAG: S46 family peptidase [Planctomycetes bacterium]|nr:S46 family peptidase [Planctomycetota bacterium]
MRSRLALVLFPLFAAATAFAAAPDEGMWTFDNPPSRQLEERYGFKLTPEWLEHVRLSSVRFPGGSGSFVSPDGLVMTNHHVALSTLHKLSSAANDYVRDGFYAETREKEAKTQDLELDVFVSYEDVTARVKGSVASGLSDALAEEARKKEIAAIEKESKEKTGLKSTVYPMYAGGEYWLYRYKTYTDVRLVMAPEQQIAFYGGDPDNFTFPRYDLDYAFFRVYEDGKPAKTPHYLKWNAQGPKDGELVFVSGNPGSTGRLNTYAQLEYLRDHDHPRTLRSLRRQIAAMKDYAKANAEQDRQAKDLIFSMENSQKAVTGYLGGLLDPEIMKKKKEAEADLRTKAKGKISDEAGDPWERIAATRARLAKDGNRFTFSRLVGGLASRALSIVRYVEEVTKPNGERLAEFRDTGLEAFQRQLYSKAPIYPDLEEARLRCALEEAATELGADDPFVKAALDGKSPAEAAKAAVAGTKLLDPEARKALVDGGKVAVALSTDSMIALARRVDSVLREIRKIQENEIQAVDRAAGAQIAKARFDVYGRTMPPDANFTLRLSYGVVRGYEEDTTLVPSKTTFFGLMERYHAFDGKYPFHLPKRVAEASINLATPLNYVHTCDIIGGNSGSPTINAKGEVVGLIFDGNIQSLVNNYQYDDRDQRAVSVHSAGMLESLKSIYHAEPLVAELLGP